MPGILMYVTITISLGSCRKNLHHCRSGGARKSLFEISSNLHSLRRLCPSQYHGGRRKYRIERLLYFFIYGCSFQPLAKCSCKTAEIVAPLILMPESDIQKEHLRHLTRQRRVSLAFSVRVEEWFCAAVRTLAHAHVIQIF